MCVIGYSRSHLLRLLVKLHAITHNKKKRAHAQLFVMCLIGAA